MKVNDAERLLGLVDVPYDETCVNVAYVKALHAAKGVSAKSRCTDARDTLERYLTSLRKSGQFGVDRKVGGTVATVGMLNCLRHGNGNAQENPSESYRDEASQVTVSAGGSAITARNGLPSFLERMAAFVSGRRRPSPVKSFDTPSENANDGVGADARNTGGRRDAYKAERAKYRPQSGDGVSFGKACLITLWDMTPWNWFLCFWGCVIATIMWLLGIVNAVSPALVELTQFVGAIAFLIGIPDHFSGRLWKRAMPASAAFIDRMR